MATNKSTLKRERQNQKRRLRNRMIKSRIHTTLKRVIAAINEKDREKVESLFRNYMSFVDKAVKVGVLHKNNAARKKSRLAIKIKKAFNEGKYA